MSDDLILAMTEKYGLPAVMLIAILYFAFKDTKSHITGSHLGPLDLGFARLESTLNHLSKDFYEFRKEVREYLNHKGDEK